MLPSAHTFQKTDHADQQDHAAEAKAMDNETAADYMLMGSVKSIVQKDGKKSVRAYFVNVQLVDIESNRIIWTGEDDSIKKIVKKSRVKF